MLGRCAQAVRKKKKKKKKNAGGGGCEGEVFSPLSLSLSRVESATVGTSAVGHKENSSEAPRGFALSQRLGGVRGRVSHTRLHGDGWVVRGEVPQLSWTRVWVAAGDFWAT